MSSVSRIKLNVNIVNIIYQHLTSKFDVIDIYSKVCAFLVIFYLFESLFNIVNVYLLLGFASTELITNVNVFYIRRKFCEGLLNPGVQDSRRCFWNLRHYVKT